MKQNKMRFLNINFLKTFQIQKYNGNFCFKQGRARNNRQGHQASNVHMMCITVNHVISYEVDNIL